MPLYDFSCTVCNQTNEVMVRLSDFKECGWEFCPKCNRQTYQELLICAPHVEDWGMGRHFEELSPKGETFYSKKQYKDYLKVNGLREWSPKTGMPGSGV